MNNKTLKNRMGMALVALSFTAFAAPAAADDITTRTAVAVGQAIAAQGNAALVEIRDEIKHALLQQIKPLLPEPAPEITRIPPPAPPVATASRQ